MKPIVAAFAAFAYAGTAHAAVVTSSQTFSFRGDGVISNFTISTPDPIPKDGFFIENYFIQGSQRISQTMSTTFSAFDTGLGRFLGATLQYQYEDGSTMGSFIGGSSVQSEAGEGGQLWVETGAILEMRTPGGTSNSRRTEAKYTADNNNSNGPVTNITRGTPGFSRSIAGFGVGRTFAEADLTTFLLDPTFDLSLELGVAVTADCYGGTRSILSSLSECSTRVSGTYGGPISATLTYTYDDAPTTSVVPLPAGLPLFGSALVGLFGLRRLRGRAA